MIRIKAKIILYKGTGRTWPIKTGYRPLFNFIPLSKTSGSITVIDKYGIEVGSTGNVFIKFANGDFLGKDILIGKQFTFDEGTIALGEGEILEIIGNE
jgi:hypothetical protein